MYNQNHLRQRSHLFLSWFNILIFILYLLFQSRWSRFRRHVCPKASVSAFTLLHKELLEHYTQKNTRKIPIVFVLFTLVLLFVWMNCMMSNNTLTMLNLHCMTWYDQLLYLQFQKFITHNTKRYFIPCDVYKTVCMKISLVNVEGMEELKTIRMFFLADIKRLIFTIVFY